MKASGQDAASSSPSRSAPDLPNPVLLRKEGNGADEAKSTLCADHFELGTVKDGKLYINSLSWFSLDFHSAADSKIGICVQPNETFVHEPKEQHAVYLFEVGLPKHQAELVDDKIQVYVSTSCGKDGDRKILIGTLSKEHAKFRLDMVLPAKMGLSHSAVRKNVYFNAFELKCKPVITGRKESRRCPVDMKKIDNRRCPEVYNHMKETEKEIWVAEVRPSQKRVFSPSDQGKLYYNLLKVFSTSSESEIEVFVECKGVTELVGTISKANPSIECDIQFDDIFHLSHSSGPSTVFFWGYTVSCGRSLSFKLEDLTSDPSTIFQLQPPKRIVDGEQNAHLALLTTRRTGANIKQGNFIPALAPVIRPPRGALA